MTTERSQNDATSDWVGGVRAVLDMLEAHPERVLEVRVGRSTAREPGRKIELLAKRARIKLHRVKREALNRLLPSVNHQGVAVRATQGVGYVALEALMATTADQQPVVVALDGVTDPHNLGAILRTAWAFEAAGVVVPKHRSAGLTPAAIKVASGGAEHVPVARVGNLVDALRDLKEAGFWVYGAAVEGEQDLPTLDADVPVVLVFGAEGQGLRRGVRKACDGLFQIRMNEAAGSLNVGVAAAVTLHHIYRLRAELRSEAGSEANAEPS